MKLGFALATIALGAASTVLTASDTVTADEDYAAKVTVEAKRASGKLGLKLKTVPDWYINKDYPLKCALKVADGGRLGKTELVKADAKFEDVAGKEGKAKSVSFSTDADKVVEGDCKIVVCSDTACSSPFKVTVKSN